MATGTVEQRLGALEQEIAQVKEHFEPENARQTNPWLDYVLGAFEDDPLFEEAVRYGREWRESQRADGDAAATVLTLNTQDFSKVPDLKIEDWSA